MNLLQWNPSLWLLMVSPYNYAYLIRIMCVKYHGVRVLKSGCNFGITTGGYELVLPNQKGVAEVVPDRHFSC